MQEIESLMVVRCKLKIPSFRITVRHHIIHVNCYPRDGIFNLHLTTIKDSYNLAYGTRFWQFSPVLTKIISVKPHDAKQ